MKIASREVEAVQLDWDNWNELCDFVTVDGFRGVYLDVWDRPIEDWEGVTDRLGAWVPDGHGYTRLAKEGDYIVRMWDGSYYPIAPDLFKLLIEENDE